MTTFFVGQRVRIKWSRSWPELIGCEGVITGKPESWAWTMTGLLGDWYVRPDGYASERLPLAASPTGFAWFAPREESLEPLTDSYDLVSWESMRDLWVPEHLREAA